MNKKTLSRILMLLLALSVFGYIGVKTDWTATWTAIQGAHYGLIFVGTIIMVLAHFLRAYRWSILGSTTGYPLNVRRAFCSVMAGYLVNAATSRGGEVVRCALTAKSEKAPVETLIGTVITERIIDLITMAFMALLCLLIQYNVISQFAYTSIWLPLRTHGPMALLILAGAAISFIVARKLFPKKEKNPNGILQKLLSGINSVFQVKEKGTFWGLSLGIWFCYWMSMYLQLEALEITEHLTIGNALAVLLFSSLGIIIPVPGGAGVWYSIAYGLTLVFGFTEGNAATFGIFTVAFSNIFHIVLGGICYGLLFYELQKNERAETA